MQVQHFMDETNLDPDSTDTKQALRVVIAYNDVAAGKRAMRVLADLGKGLGEDIEFQPLPWSFDLLADMDWREVAAHDAVKADILIIATSSTNPLPSSRRAMGQGHHQPEARNCRRRRRPLRFG